MDGTHPIERCEEVTEAALRVTFAALSSAGVLLEGLILKPNMVLAGKNGPQASDEEVARRTIQTLRRAVPAAVAGIVFLSGGQNDRDATARLNAINNPKNGAPWQLPWPLSFSFARALQDEAMKTWKGEAANVPDAQKAFAHRLRLNSAARAGRYEVSMEDAAAPCGSKAA